VVPITSPQCCCARNNHWFTVFYTFTRNFLVHRATKQPVGSVFIRGVVVAHCLCASLLLATEYHGTVKSGGLPIPGAAVTATQGDKKSTTTTDEEGSYTFADLPDGAWTITVEMFGFDKTSREVSIAPPPTVVVERSSVSM
jgi:hypothetical protein